MSGELAIAKAADEVEIFSRHLSGGDVVGRKVIISDSDDDDDNEVMGKDSSLHSSGTPVVIEGDPIPSDASSTMEVDEERGLHPPASKVTDRSRKRGRPPTPPASTSALRRPKRGSLPQRRRSARRRWRTNVGGAQLLFGCFFGPIDEGVSREDLEIDRGGRAKGGNDLEKPSEPVYPDPEGRGGDCERGHVRSRGLFEWKRRQNGGGQGAGAEEEGARLLAGATPSES